MSTSTRQACNGLLGVAELELRSSRLAHRAAEGRLRASAACEPMKGETEMDERTRVNALRAAYVLSERMTARVNGDPVPAIASCEADFYELLRLHDEWVVRSARA